MSQFDKVIGYDSIKQELLEICDIIKNRDVYKKLGAKLPHGILLYGDPGLGKTLVAKCFIEESGIKSYTIRRNKGDATFIDCITSTFEEAKKNAPCIILLDDLDKFSTTDDAYGDEEEYVAVQAGIDEVANSDVLVVATVNNLRKLPVSLYRSGRFDRKIYFESPSSADAEKIISHFLSNKNVSSDVNMGDLSKMISYSSCAKLESIINDAAISAGFNRHDQISMDDIVKVVLRNQYGVPDENLLVADGQIEKTALHEAGHAVVLETLVPGSVGLVSIRRSGRSNSGGFVHCCKDVETRRAEIMVSLAGKAAVELYFSETVASGCQSDLDSAFTMIKDGIAESATNGLGFLGKPESADGSFLLETVVHAELEHYMVKTKEILLKNRAFLEAVRNALIEKDTLLSSDIQAIKESVEITKVAV